MLLQAERRGGAPIRSSPGCCSCCSTPIQKCHWQLKNKVYRHRDRVREKSILVLPSFFYCTLRWFGLFVRFSRSLRPAITDAKKSLNSTAPDSCCCCCYTTAGWSGGRWWLYDMMASSTDRSFCCGGHKINDGPTATVRPSVCLCAEKRIIFRYKRNEEEEVGRDLIDHGGDSGTWWEHREHLSSPCCCRLCCLYWSK